VLHGDIHHQNILEDDRGNWRAIDPKGLCQTAREARAAVTEGEI